MIRLLLLTTVACFGFLGLEAQSLSNVRAETLGDSVRISYRLNDAFAGRTYSVSLLGIVEGDTVSLDNLSGSIGDSIRAGQHDVYWSFVPQYGRFKGAVSFYVRALPDFYISAPDTGTVVKRGKPITFSWYGGNAYLDTLQLELYQYDQKFYTIDVVGQANQYTWKVPNALPADDGYRLKVTGTDLTHVEGYSNQFTVKRAYPPVALFAVPALFVGGLVWGIATDFWILPKPLGRDRTPVR